MLSFYYFFLICLVGFLGSYLACLAYVKVLRGDSHKNVKDYDVILSSLLFGGPVGLVMELVFKEMRQEDATNHYRLLLSLIGLTIIQVVATYLLFHFNVVYWIPSTDASSSSSIALAILSRITL
jgi:predicted ATP-dependent Lon-type protease